MQSQNGNHDQVHISDIFKGQYMSKVQMQRERQRLDHDAERIKTSEKIVKSFIHRLCEQLKLNEWVEHTALVYAQRFFARRSFERNDVRLISGASVFLATKTTDSLRSINHVAQAYFRVQHINKPDEIEALKANPEEKLRQIGLMDALLSAEWALLFTLNFNVSQYRVSDCLRTYLLASGIYTLGLPKEADSPRKPANQLSQDDEKKLTRLCLQLCKDIFKTKLMCQYPPETAAAAMPRLASELSGVPFVAPCQGELSRLPSLYELPEDAFQCIREQLMGLYQRIDTPKPKSQQATQQSTAAPAPLAKHAVHAQQQGVVMHSITGEPMDAQSPEDHNNKVGCGFEPEALEETHAAAAVADQVVGRKRSASVADHEDGEIPEPKTVRVG